MKIIIDIPEKVVTAIQNGEDYRYDIHTAIAQGTPYEERPPIKENTMTISVKKDTHKAYWDSVGTVEYGEEAKTDLCETCINGDVCESSTKIFSCCRTTQCYKYEEVDND